MLVCGFPGMIEPEDGRNMGPSMRHRGQLPSEIIGINISFCLSHKNAGTLVVTF